MSSASSPDSLSINYPDVPIRWPRTPYKPKGFGTIVAVLIVAGYLYFSRILFAKFWPYVLENTPKHYIMLVSGLFIHTGLAIFNNLVMYVIYKIKLLFFERYRISDNPWPWESNPEKWNKLLKRTLKTLAFSHFVVIPALMIIDGMNELVMRIDIESLPSMKEMISQILFFMITDDFLFYWSHRTLHHPKLYPYIHKIHHEYTITVSIAGEYAHPLEFLVGNIIPMNAGAKLLGSRVHILTYFLWGIIKLVESVDAHCGYEFSWSPYKLMLLGRRTTLANYHDFHHSHNVGNYSSQFTFWDTLFGTNKRYFEYLDKKEKMT